MSNKLPPLKIGSVPIGFPVVQAALSGYSDWAMRRIARSRGAAYTLCEVMLDQFLLSVRQRKRTQHFLYLTDDDHPVGGQLMGAEPEQFAAGAQRLVAAGFDVIDINFGCPVKKVLGRCRGGYHLSQPDVALEIVRRTRDAVPPEIPVTVKMRCGIDDSPLSRERFFTILDGAFDAGIAAATVHARTVQQRYVGPSRWEVLAEVKRHAGQRTILGSGDLFAADDCQRMLQQTGVDGVTVARGAIGNPWIFRDLRCAWEGRPLPPPPELAEQRLIMLEHFDRVLQGFPEKRAIGYFRKFVVHYAKRHPKRKHVLQALLNAGTQTEVRAGIDAWYNGQFH
jgi:tRNA-dihydrouridine synthase B